MTNSNQASYFIVLTQGRTGSTAIVDELNCHPGLTCFQELLNRFGYSAYRHEATPFVRFIAENGNATFDDYLDWLPSVSDATVVGMKILMNNLDELVEHRPLERLINRGAKIIYLDREPLTKALSGALARARGLYNVRASQLESARVDGMCQRTAIDLEKFESALFNFIENRHRPPQLVRKLGAEPFIVNYETYCDDRARFFREIFEFLDVNPNFVPRGTDWQRVTSPDIWDDIENPDEVHRVIERTNAKFKRMSFIERLITRMRG